MATARLTPDLLLTLAVIAGALALFVWGRLRADVVGLLVLVTLVLLGLVSPEEGFSGFANEALITVAAMLVLSSGLLRTGALDAVAAFMARFARGSELRLLVAVLAVVVPLSAVVNNTAAVSILLPVVLGAAREMGAAPSRLLMPLSFGAQLGGSLTLVGTSTNLLVAGVVLELGVARLGLFDVTLPGLFVVATGGLYLLTLGRRLLPTRPPADEEIRPGRLRTYLAGLVVVEGSALAGRLATELPLAEHGVEFAGLERGGEPVSEDEVVRPGDRILVRGEVERIKHIESSDLARIARVEPLAPRPDARVGNAAHQLAEAIVLPRARAVGRTVRRVRALRWFGIHVLAVERHGELLHGSVERVVLRSGDILLVEGTGNALRRLHRSGELALLGVVRVQEKRRRKRALATAIVAAVVTLPALGVLPISVSALAGVAAMFVGGCLSPAEAYEDLDGMVIVLLGSILPLGIAMQRSGAAELLGGLLTHAAAPLGPYGLIAAVYLLTSALTEVVTNNAAAIVLTPVAVSAAAATGASPLPFVIAVMFAASNSFMTPVGYQTNTFIYAPGGYRFGDFARVGAPLNLALLATATFAIPLFHPFAPK